MSLRARLVSYLVVVHLVFAGLGALLLRQSRWWLIGLELAFALSLFTGIRLTRRVLHTLSFSSDAARLLREDEVTSRFLSTGDSEVDALIGVYNRMMDRLREERTRLREQHHLFTQVLEQSPSGFIILDFDGRLDTLNPAAERMLQVAAASVHARPLAALASPLASALAALPPQSDAVISLSGPRRVKIQHGSFLDRGFMRSFFLIDELTEELRQFERSAYEKLIRVMSHEVNNSVTAANSLLQSSLTYASDLSPAHRVDYEQALGIVIDRTQQLNLFMRRFADVFRLPAPIVADVELRDLAEPPVRLTAARADAAGIDWRWRVQDASLIVAVDRGQFELVLLNLLKNAVEAAGPGGAITLHVLRADGRPRLIVEDSGPGLSVEAQRNVFTPFFSTKPNGQGIGLTLVSEILTAHGVKYALDSRPDHPTTFTIDF